MADTYFAPSKSKSAFIPFDMEPQVVVMIIFLVFCFVFIQFVLWVQTRPQAAAGHGVRIASQPVIRVPEPQAPAARPFVVGALDQWPLRSYTRALGMIPAGIAPAVGQPLVPLGQIRQPPQAHFM